MTDQESKTAKLQKLGPPGIGRQIRSTAHVSEKKLILAAGRRAGKVPAKKRKP